MKKEHVKSLVIALVVIAAISTTIYVYKKNKKAKVAVVTTGASLPAGFDAKAFLQGNWNLRYSTASDNGGTEDAVILGDTYTIVGTPSMVYKLKDITFEPTTKTLSFTKVDTQGNVFPSDVLVVDTVSNKMTGTEGGWNVVYSKK